ncbi:hypothetical protein EJB05_35092, partial [Eragrostis curvula]
MATLGSGSPIPAAAAPASAVADTSSSWAPHGTVLTAFVVSINLLVILLIFFFFWRFFSGKQPGQSAGGEDDEDDDALPVASPWATRRHRRRDAPRKEVDVASSLPVHVYSSAAAGGKAVECAVCIVELRDGDAARLLPRCGHQFHADCVGQWLRLHATCPLCRARVVAPPAAAAAAEAVNPKDAVVVGADSPV